ncbi:MAG: sulfurtransferase [Salibacteraceae bacterium]|jgi:thiosulfate/3-mercaptopyruvate sulfurtransferase|nr:sulfurtransferase [Salibacteraceae bacterium]MDP4763476.1 sulfurtransferase [Salibacteraceae bacterium]MDP4934889.1 sulfurtransferase [Salibacteraceae bacterium]MDP4964031.1 sulfurtransferase [Salibacteraceae bacterium]
MQSPLVSAAWLNDHLNDPRLIILDASTKTNISGKKSEYDDLQILGSRYFDLKNNFSDAQASFPNTIPSAEAFEKEAQKLGVNEDSVIVIYDNLGIYNSPRAWWMFRAMGHENVAVLDGGLPAWVKGNFKTQSIHSEPETLGNFKAHFDKSQVKSIEDVLTNINKENFTVIDARSKGRFDGTAPEPREGMSSGHIPNSCNLPFETVLDNGFMKSTSELKSLFDSLQLNENPLVFSCGSGLTACIILLAAELVNDQPKAIFDGSWTEWASTEGTPIDKV